MAALDPSALRLSPRYLETVRRILRQTLPQAEVWAYGSRVTGGGHTASDLDLVARNPADPNQEQPGIAAARTAFMESSLPIRVEVVDWARIPEGFRREIARGYIVAQTLDESEGIASNFEGLGI
ncbi:MAG: nucleotidyltransferase domain-containing protein [Magnetococcales bacterium]|nr:nucleotidyltransferase domain-containing protein [Magnetococcales bacterium]